MTLDQTPQMRGTIHAALLTVDQARRQKDEIHKAEPDLGETTEKQNEFMMSGTFKSGKHFLGQSF